MCFICRKLNVPTKRYPCERCDLMERIYMNLETYRFDLNVCFNHKACDIKQINFLKPDFFCAYTMVWKYLPSKIVKDLDKIMYMKIAGRCLINVSFISLSIRAPSKPTNPQRKYQGMFSFLFCLFVSFYYFKNCGKVYIASNLPV